MTLEKISSEKLLINLSKEDIKLLNLTFEKLALNNINSKIKQLLKNIALKSELTDFIHDPKFQLNVELLQKNEKYSVFITREKNDIKKSNKKIFLIKKETVPYIFKFKNLNDFMDLSKKLAENNFKVSNSLLRYRKNYYIILYFKKTTISDLEKITLTEHAKFIGKGWPLAAKILEFGTEIVKNNAILKFAKFL